MLLISHALAAEVPEVPRGARTVGVLVCPTDDLCDAHARWVDALGGTTLEPYVRLDLVLALDDSGWAAGRDARGRLVEARARAVEHAEKGRWKAVEAALDEADAALAALDVTVSNAELFDLWYLRGAAQLARGVNRGHEYSFRQAAAIADTPRFPFEDEATRRAYADESRKLAVGGQGTLTLGEPPEGVRYFVDGAEASPGPTLRYPGNHRVTAVSPGKIRTWKVEVPVLAGRTVAVTAAFSPEDSAAWVQGRLERAFDALDAPPSVTARLATWADRQGIAQIELMRVVTRDPLPGVDPITMSRADARRPAAAGGEAVDHGDGIPSTYEQEVSAIHEGVTERRPEEGARELRIVYFDTRLRRFSTDSGAALVRPDTEEPPFELYGQLGYTRMLEHHHAAVDIGGAWRPGAFGVEAKIGLVRADSSYNLYADWVDAQLYHVTVGARWSPSWRVRPFATLGPEIYIPVAVGGRLGAGAEARLDHNWRAQVEGYFSLLNVAGEAEGAGGIGIGVGRVY